MLRRNLQSMVLAILFLIGTAQALQAQLAVGDQFPALAEMSFEGQLPVTAGRVLLVDFWASWCAPCKLSFPALARLHAEYSQHGVVILGVSVDQNAGAYTTFLKKHAPPFATVRDREQKLIARVKAPAMPTSYIIGPDGRIRAILAGYHGDTTDQALRAVLNTALAEKSVP